MTEYNKWRREVRELAAPLSPVRIEWQMEHHFWIVTLRLIVRMASWVVGKMSKDGLVSVTVIIVGRILDWGVLNAVTLRVANRFFTSSRNC